MNDINLEYFMVRSFCNGETLYAQELPNDGVLFLCSFHGFYEMLVDDDDDDAVRNKLQLNTNLSTFAPHARAPSIIIQTFYGMRSA